MRSGGLSIEILNLINQIKYEFPEYDLSEILIKNETILNQSICGNIELLKANFYVELYTIYLNLTDINVKKEFIEICSILRLKVFDKNNIKEISIYAMKIREFFYNKIRKCSFNAQKELYDELIKILLYSVLEEYKHIIAIEENQFTAPMILYNTLTKDEQERLFFEFSNLCSEKLKASLKLQYRLKEDCKLDSSLLECYFKENRIIPNIVRVKNISYETYNLDHCDASELRADNYLDFYSIIREHKKNVILSFSTSFNNGCYETNARILTSEKLSYEYSDIARDIVNSLVKSYLDIYHYGTGCYVITIFDIYGERYKSAKYDFSKKAFQKKIV